MGKIAYIKNLENKKLIWNKNSISRALVFCLSGEEACHALASFYFRDETIRRALLNKIEEDIRNKGFQHYHRQFIEDIISSIESLPYIQKKTCGRYLYYFYNHVPSDLQTKVINNLANSSYKFLRDRGFSVLRHFWNEEYRPLIQQVWEKHHDYRCALLLLEHFPDSVITKNFRAIHRALKNQPGEAKLLVRRAQKKPSILKQLRKEDAITYTYVMVKLGKVLSTNDAKEIFEQCKTDDRIPIFIWSLGRMGLWEVLQDIASRSDELLEEQYNFRWKRYENLGLLKKRMEEDHE